MPRIPAIPPWKGASNNSSFWSTGQPFAPASALLNVIPFDATKDRPRIGVRPGTDQYFPGTWGGGSRIQGMGVVSRGRTATGYTLGTSTDLPTTDGAAHTQAAIAGNVWKFAPNWGLSKYTYEDVTAAGPYADTGDSGADDTSVNAVAISPDGTKIIIGESYNVTGDPDRVARITCLNATTLALIWTARMSDNNIHRFVNAIACNAEWVFVCTNHFIRIFKLSDGSNPSVGSAVSGMNSWSSEAIDCAVTSDGNSLLVLFYGTTIGTTLDSGIEVTDGIYAAHFRSGVMKFTIATQAQLTDGTYTKVLNQTTLSPQLENTEDYYEAPGGDNTKKHNYLRFSEQMPWGPRGCKPTAIALLPDGGFVVTHANAGWGPRGTAGAGYYPPDGSPGFWNISAFTAAGVFIWKYDGDSLHTEAGFGGFFNDIGNPTAIDVATDTEGNVYVCGRRTKPIGDADGFTCIALDRYGDFLWTFDLGATMRTVSVMETSQNVIIGGDRDDSWEGSPGGTTNAHLFEMNKLDGSIIRYADLGNVSVLGTAPMDGDSLAFVTDKL